MFVTSNVYLNIILLHIACGFELLHNPFKVSNRTVHKFIGIFVLGHHGLTYRLGPDNA